MVNHPSVGGLDVASVLAGARGEIEGVEVHATIGEARREVAAPAPAPDPGPDALAAYLLGEGVRAFRPAMDRLARYRRRNAPEHPYAVEDWHLWELYALSRVNDYLLLPFQSAEPIRDDLPRLSEEAYVAFFVGLGFEAFRDRPYAPFYHEIVEVEESPDAAERVEVARVLWPGLTYGDLLFSRAGVRVRCRPGILDPVVATRSTLYWAFLRLRRPRVDLSDGWGHNSQWRTDFRRDYADGGFHFNLDGEIDLGGPEPPRIPRDPDKELTLAQRRELLVHRSFVTAPIADTGDFFPYRYRLTAECAVPLWPH